MPLYPMNYYKTKKAFKEAIKREGSVPVYDVGIQPITKQNREPITVRINGKPRKVIPDTLVGPGPEDRKWYATIYLDAEDFERGLLWVVKAK